MASPNGSKTENENSFDSNNASGSCASSDNRHSLESEEQHKDNSDFCKTTDIKEAIKVRGIKKSAFTRCLKICQMVIDNGGLVSAQKFEELSNARAMLLRAHESVLLGVDDISAIESDEYLDSVDSDFEAIRSHVCKDQATGVSMSTPIDISTVISSLVKDFRKMKEEDASHASHSIATQSEVLKKRVAPPIFHGDIRNYYVWKANFRNNFESSTNSVAMLQLLEALGESERMKVEHLVIKGTIEEMFMELDAVYGDKRKISKSIMSAVNAIPRCRSNCIDDFHRLYENLKDALAQLDAIDCKAHLRHFNSVETIEKKLPEEYKMRWAEISIGKDVTVDNMFDKLVEFIKHHVAIGEQLHRMRDDADSWSVTQSYMQTSQTFLNVATTDVRPGVSLQRSSKDSNTGFVFCPLHGKPVTHGLGRCYVLKNASSENKVKWLKEELKDYCRTCLKKGHDTSSCKSNIACYRCQGRHFEFLHDSLDVISGQRDNQCYRSVCQDVLNTYKGDAICPAHYAELSASTEAGSDTRTVSVLYDSGSNITMVRSDLAESMRLPVLDRQVLCFTTVSGEKVRIVTPRYLLRLANPNDRQLTYEVTAFGIPKIGSDFPELPAGIERAAEILGVQEMYRTGLLRRPSGKLDVLIGTDAPHCLPFPERPPTDGIILAKNKLGYVLFGKHPAFEGTHSGHYRAVVMLVDVESSSSDHSRILDFFSTESIGVDAQVKCGDCKCGTCPIGSDSLSMTERHELELVKTRMSYDRDRKIITASYPIIKDISNFPNNYPMVFKSLVQLEKGLIGNLKLANEFKDQFQDMIDRNVIRKLSHSEITEWKGTVNYLPMQYVIKPDSKSTPLRIVMDTARRYLGQCISDYWPKGPNMITNLLGLLVRFREEPIAVFGDIKKMYQSVHTDPATWHLHRLLWRDLDVSRDPEVYVVTRNSFGSKPAGLVAILGLHMVADLGMATFPLGARCIREQMYVDDCLVSARSAEDAKELIRQIDGCLSLGNFSIKKWTIVGPEKDPDDKWGFTMRPAEHQTVVGTATFGTVSQEYLNIGGKKECESVLGVKLALASDAFVFEPKLNFSKRDKKTKTRAAADLQKDEIFDRDRLPCLTKRMVLSMIMTIYDPLGLLGPYLTELKFTLAKLWRHRTPEGQELAWDSPLPVEFDDHFRRIFNNIFELATIDFQRCIRPTDSIGDPWLVLCSDSSTMAYGCVAYVRFKRMDGSFSSRLVGSKCRIWPIVSDDYISIVRGELQGALLANRFAKFIQEESRYTFERVLFVVDSEIVRAQISSDSHCFDVFVGRRVAEIQKTTSPEQWFWISGKSNECADLLTRGTMSMDLLNGRSAWQLGPAFLEKHFDDWGVSQQLSESALVTGLRRDQSLTSRSMCCSVCEDWSTLVNATAFMVDGSARREILSRQMWLTEIIDIRRYSSVCLLHNVTAILWRMAQWHGNLGSFRAWCSQSMHFTADDIECVQRMWIRRAQQDVASLIHQGGLKKLNPYQDEQGVWRAGGRLQAGEGYHPIILDNTHLYTKLVAMQIHQRGHNGVTVTMAKIRASYYIEGLNKLVTDIRKHCVRCRILDHSTVKLPMAKLPPTRYRPHFPFENISVDLFGPFLLRVPGKVTRGRPMDSYGKGYGVMITCLATRAVHIEVMEGGDTDAFLLAMRRFMSIRGQPRSVWSDNGGQIAAGDKELQDVMRQWDRDVLGRFGATEGIRWAYSAPGASWQNGVTEALIKSAKRALKLTMDSKPRIPVLELQTLFYEVASLLNERPLNPASLSNMHDIEAGTYLCPNQLLYGRCTSRINAGPFVSTDVSAKDRFLAIQTLVDNWWYKFTTDVLPMFYSQSKWFVEGRTVQIGDIVHVRDLNAVRGEWKIAEVVGVEDSHDSEIRNVKLRYKSPGRIPGRSATYRGFPSRYEIRDVKTLVVILPKEER